MAEKFKLTATLVQNKGTESQQEETLSFCVEPKSVTFKKKHMTNSERTLGGDLIVDHIATKNTVSVSWDVLDDKDFGELLNLIEGEKDNSYFTLEYLKPGEGAEQTVEMTVYTEEVSYYPYFLANGRVVWRDVSVNFEEV